MLTNGREIEKSVCFTYIFSFCAIGSVNMKVNVGDRVEMKKPHPCGCKEFEILRKMPSLWTRSYFVSTAGNVCSETIKKYVENQKTRY